MPRWSCCVANGLVDRVLHPLQIPSVLFGIGMKLLSWTGRLISMHLFALARTIGTSSPPESRVKRRTGNHSRIAWRDGRNLVVFHPFCCIQPPPVPHFVFSLYSHHHHLTGIAFNSGLSFSRITFGKLFSQLDAIPLFGRFLGNLRASQGNGREQGNGHGQLGATRAGGDINMFQSDRARTRGKPGKSSFWEREDTGRVWTVHVSTERANRRREGKSGSLVVLDWFFFLIIIIHKMLRSRLPAGIGIGIGNRRVFVFATDIHDPVLLSVHFEVDLMKVWVVWDLAFGSSSRRGERVGR